MRRVQIITVLSAAALASAAGLAEGASIPTHQLTVKVAGTGSGQIHGSSIDCMASSGGPVGPCTISELSGNRVTLTASADKGSVFVGWSGGGCSGTGACAVTLNRNVTVTAKFNVGVVAAESGPVTVSSSKHTGSLRMRCLGPGTCNGTVEFSTVASGKSIKLASANYNIAQGTTVAVTLRFGSRAVALIARHHNALNAELTVLPNETQPSFAKRVLKLA